MVVDRALVGRAKGAAHKAKDLDAGAESWSERQRRRGLGGYLTWPFVVAAALGADLFSSRARAAREQGEEENRAGLDKLDAYDHPEAPNEGALQVASRNPDPENDESTAAAAAKLPLPESLPRFEQLPDTADAGAARDPKTSASFGAEDSGGGAADDGLSGGSIPKASGLPKGDVVDNAGPGAGPGLTIVPVGADPRHGSVDGSESGQAPGTELVGEIESHLAAKVELSGSKGTVDLTFGWADLRAELVGDVHLGVGSVGLSLDAAGQLLAQVELGAATDLDVPESIKLAADPVDLLAETMGLSAEAGSQTGLQVTSLNLGAQLESVDKLYAVTELFDMADAASRSDGADAALEQNLVPVQFAGTAESGKMSGPADILASSGDLSAGNTIEIPDIGRGQSTEDELFSGNRHTEYGIELNSDKAGPRVSTDAAANSAGETHDVADLAESDETIATTLTAEDDAPLTPLTTTLAL